MGDDVGAGLGSRVVGNGMGGGVGARVGIAVGVRVGTGNGRVDGSGDGAGDGGVDGSGDPQIHTGSGLKKNGHASVPELGHVLDCHVCNPLIRSFELGCREKTRCTPV